MLIVSPNELAIDRAGSDRGMDQKQLMIFDGYENGYYPSLFKLPVLHCHIWPGGGFTPLEKLQLGEYLMFLCGCLVLNRPDLDSEMSARGIFIHRCKMYLGTEEVAAYRYVYRLLTGQNKDIVTFTDVRNSEYRGAQVCITNPIVGNNLNNVAAVNITEEDRNVASYPLAPYRRDVFVQNGGIGYAVYLDGGLFRFGLTLERRLNILFTAIIEATCQNYGNVLIYLEKRLVISPMHLDLSDHEYECY